MVFDLLVRRDAAHEQKVDEPVVQNLVERGPRRRLRDAGRIDGDRKHPRPRETERLELPAVVFRIAEREIDAARERGDLAPAKRRETE